MLLSAYVLGLIVLITIVIDQAQASECCYNKTEYPVYIGFSDAVAEKEFAYTGSYFNCKVRSKLSPASYINILGWTAFHCSYFCNGTVIDYDYRGGYDDPGTGTDTGWHFSNNLYWRAGCTGDNSYGYNEGNHDFNHDGVPQWQPSLSTVLQ